MEEDNKKILKDIKELLEIVQHKVNNLESMKFTFFARSERIKDQQSVMNDKLDQILELLEDKPQIKSSSEFTPAEV